MHESEQEENPQPTAGTVVLAAGGTGGHIFPAQALAEALQARGYRPVLITDKRSKKYPAVLAEENVLHIASRSLSGGVLKLPIALLKNTLGYWQARKYLKQLKPVAVVGFGGYPSFPTMFAAVHMGLHTVLHEQNSVLGRVNRVLAPKVDVIATAFDQVRHIRDEDHTKVHVVGNLVRQEVQGIKDMRYPELGKDEHIHLLVTGGSQGAKIFGEVVPEAVALLPEELRKRLRVDQQCYEPDIERVKGIYEKAGVDADLAPFFKDIAARLANCHLVIARAGAGTITELAIAGRPSILVPLPSAMDDHQTVNCEALVHVEAAIHLPQKQFSKERLAEELEKLLGDHTRLAEMAENARKLSKPGAAEALLELVVSN